MTSSKPTPTPIGKSPFNEVVDFRKVLTGEEAVTRKTETKDAKNGTR
jgi:hypothetical protein